MATAFHLVILSKETKPTPRVEYMHPIFVAQDNATILALEQNSKRIQARHNTSSESRSRDPQHKDVMMMPELTLSSLAWLTASAAMRDVLSAVLEQLSARGGKKKGHYICTLRNVADEAEIVLLVLDAHYTNRNRGRGNSLL
ncbi:hypothetical protein EDB87DRAFT_1580483 [Lactarius vividus]|nr:hypothetical protein EDB87DRAFT_1580483 [Lactarius vividus]